MRLLCMYRFPRSFWKRVSEGRDKAEDHGCCEELGYRPNALAVNLKTGRRQTLALILPSLTNIYYPKLEKYLEAYATEKGYIIYLNNTEYNLEKEKQIVDNLIGMDIAGVIITPTSGEHAHIMKLAEYNIPYVYLNRYFEDDVEHCLQMDNKTAAHDAVDYMIKLGHKHIGGIFQSFDNSTYRDRYEGMLAAMEEHGLDCDPGNVMFDVNPGGYRKDARPHPSVPGKSQGRPGGHLCLQRYDSLQHLPRLLHSGPAGYRSICLSLATMTA